MRNGILQIPRMSLLSVHMHIILWLRAWSVDLAWERYLLCIPFESEFLFGKLQKEYIEDERREGGSTPTLHIYSSLLT